MSRLKAIFGISGHNSFRASIIAAIAEESEREARELNERLCEYKKKSDPFGALMIDLYNKRASEQTLKQR